MVRAYCIDYSVPTRLFWLFFLICCLFYWTQQPNNCHYKYQHCMQYYVFVWNRRPYIGESGEWPGVPGTALPALPCDPCYWTHRHKLRTRVRYQHKYGSCDMTQEYELIFFIKKIILQFLFLMSYISENANKYPYFNHKTTSRRKWIKWTKLETSHVAYVASYRYSNAQKE